MSRRRLLCYLVIGLLLGACVWEVASEAPTDPLAGPTTLNSMLAKER